MIEETPDCSVIGTPVSRQTEHFNKGFRRDFRRKEEILYNHRERERVLVESRFVKKSTSQVCGL